MGPSSSAALYLGVPVWLQNRNDPSISERKDSYGDTIYTNAEHAEACYKMWESCYADWREEEKVVTLDHDPDQIFTLVECAPALASTRIVHQYYWVVDRDINSGHIGTINKAYDTWKKHMTKELREELATDFVDDIVMTFDCDEPKVVVLMDISM
jgi:hypothetical protein